MHTLPRLYGSLIDNIMKKILCLILCLSIVPVFNIFCFAHSGRTDSNGGHYNHATNSYHYHCGGHPAHDHTNGECPYDSEKEHELDLGSIIIMTLLGIIIVSLILSALCTNAKFNDFLDVIKAIAFFALIILIIVLRIAEHT